MVTKVPGGLQDVLLVSSQKIWAKACPQLGSTRGAHLTRTHGGTLICTRRYVALKLILEVPGIAQEALHYRPRPASPKLKAAWDLRYGGRLTMQQIVLHAVALWAALGSSMHHQGRRAQPLGSVRAVLPCRNQPILGACSILPYTIRAFEHCHAGSPKAPFWSNLPDM